MIMLLQCLFGDTKGVQSVEYLMLVCGSGSDLTWSLQFFEFRLSSLLFLLRVDAANSRFSWKLDIKRSLDVVVVHTILGSPQYGAILFLSRSYKLKTCWEPTVSFRSTFCCTR